jgi:hypothetical protein
MCLQSQLLRTDNELRSCACGFAGRVRTTVLPLQALQGTSVASTRSTPRMPFSPLERSIQLIDQTRKLCCATVGGTGAASPDVVLPQLPGVTLDKGPSVFVNPFSTFKFKDKWHFVDHVGQVHRPDLMAQLLGTETWPPPDSDEAE